LVRRETFTALSDALTPVEGYIGDQATMTGGGVAVRFALQTVKSECRRFTNRQN
jgi:hypothetical protein